MNPKLSFHLNFLRGAASICVMLHHYSGHIVSGPVRVFPDIGQESVIVFFVISGFIIAYVGTERENNLSEFLVRRLARLWSVLLPAIAITVGCYLWVRSIDPEASFLDGNGSHLIRKAIAAVTFINWNSFTRGYWLPGGGVMWSLTCEFWYYLLFAAWMFLPNRWPKWTFLAFAILLLGFKPMLLFPIWLMGAYAFVRLRSGTVRIKHPAVVIAAAMAAASLLQVSGLRYEILRFPGRFHAALDQAFYAPYYWILGGLVVFYILAIASLPNQEKVPPSWIVRPTRAVADVSYFLYLTHVPIMWLLSALLSHREPFAFFIPFVTLACALLVGKPIENSKRWYARHLRTLFETRALAWMKGFSVSPIRVPHQQLCPERERV